MQLPKYTNNPLNQSISKLFSILKANITSNHLSKRPIFFKQDLELYLMSNYQAKSLVSNVEGDIDGTLDFRLNPELR